LGIAFAVALLLAVGVIAERLLVTATIGQRIAMWAAATQAWFAHLITGAGPGSFPWVLQTTGYFDSNSIAPRHPDSAIFQLLPELGLLGIAIGAILALTVGAVILRNADRPTTWSITVFLVGGLAGNPTDFAFLIAVFLVWGAIATRVPREITGSHLMARPLLVGLSAPILIALVATTSGGIAYDRASALVADGRLSAAGSELSVAMALDPGMALYVRQHGAIALLTGHPSEAVHDLSIATSINPNDDLAWRTLALAYVKAADPAAASAAIRAAVRTQRSDPTNLLLAVGADLPGLPTAHFMAEAIQAWPEVVLAPGWSQFVPRGMTTQQVLALARDRWAHAAQSPEPRVDQPFTIALLLGDRIGASRAADAINLPSDLTSAQVAVVTCAAEAAKVVGQLKPVVGSPYYWRLFLQADGVSPDVVHRAARAYEILTARALAIPSSGFLNPLDENDSLGYSGDVWGYRRLPISWPSSGMELPSPGVGRTRWVVALRTALVEAGLARNVGCSR
jgi:hypothetical protein